MKDIRPEIQAKMMGAFYYPYYNKTRGYYQTLRSRSHLQAELIFTLSDLFIHQKPSGMTNITNQLCEYIYVYLDRIETDNDITQYTRLLIPGRRLIYITTELGWQDQLFLPVRLQLLHDI